MKILIITSSPTPKNEIRSIFIHNRLKILKSMKVNFDVVSPVFEIKWLIKTASKILSGVDGFCHYPESFSFEGIDYRFIIQKYGITQYTASHIFKSYKTLYKNFEKQILKKYNLSQYDLIHAHFALPNGIIAKKYLSKNRYPIYHHFTRL